MYKNSRQEKCMLEDTLINNRLLYLDTEYDVTHGRRSSKQFGGAPNFCPKNLSLQLNFAQKNFQHIVYGNGIKITNFGSQMLTAKKLIH